MFGIHVLPPLFGACNIEFLRRTRTICIREISLYILEDILYNTSSHTGYLYMAYANRTALSHIECPNVRRDRKFREKYVNGVITRATCSFSHSQLSARKAIPPKELRAENVNVFVKIAPR